MQALAQPYPTVPEARLERRAGRMERGRQGPVARRGARGVEAAARLGARRALFVAQVLQRRSNEEAVRFLGEFLAHHPKARDARLELRAAARRERAQVRRGAQAVRGAGRASSRRTRTSAMAVALLAMQANDYDAAETQLKRVAGAGLQGARHGALLPGAGQRGAQALRRSAEVVSSVGAGEQYISAQSRYAGVLAKQGKLAGSAQAPAGSAGREQPAARAAHPGRSAAPARCERIPGRIRPARPGARRSCRTTPISSTTTRWRRRR